MFYTVYKITCSINNKIYIGKHQTKSLTDGYMGSGQNLKRSQKKYGLDKFSKEILFVFDSEEEMNNKEKELVTEEFCLREDTYNICPGGKGGFGYINTNGLSVPIQKQNVDFKAASILGNTKRKYKLETDHKFRENFCRSVSISSRLQFQTGTHPFQNLKCSPNLGKVWITDGIRSKKINKSESLPEGWRFGRS